MGDESYLEPNRKAQYIVLLMLVLFAVIVALFEPMIHRITPSTSAPLEELEAGGKLLVLLALGTFVVAIAVSIFWAAYFARLGYRTLKVGSYPPPGTIVVFRTRIRTGKLAVLSGYLSIAFAALLVAPMVLLGYATWLLTSAL
jgi:hypothetical protein